MENPLSQAELDALMDEFYQSRDSVQAYDFKRPSKFGKDRMQALVMIHENFARLLTGFFAAGLRTRAQVQLRGVHQYTFSELAQVLVSPTVLCAFRLDPLPGVALLEVSQNIAYAIVERVLGGVSSDNQPQRGLTEIELSVIERQIMDMLSSLKEAWRNVSDIHPTLGQMETNPMFMQVMPPSEVLAVLTLSVEIGEHLGHITLGLPFTTVEPVLTKLSPHSWLSTVRPADEEEQQTIREHVQFAPVSLKVSLGKTQINVGQFLALQPGQVLRLDSHTGDELAVQVGNRLTFYGRPGISRGRAAVQITRYVNRASSTQEATAGESPTK